MDDLEGAYKALSLLHHPPPVCRLRLLSLFGRLPARADIERAVQEDDA